MANDSWKTLRDSSCLRGGLGTGFTTKARRREESPSFWLRLSTHEIQSHPCPDRLPGGIDYSDGGHPSILGELHTRRVAERNSHAGFPELRRKALSRTSVRS